MSDNVGHNVYCRHRSILFSLKWWVFWLSAVAWCFCFTKSDQSISLQAKFIAEIIIVGAQVVGRAFTQALRQEFQSISSSDAIDHWNVFTYSFVGLAREPKQVLFFLATISYHLAYWSGTLILRWKCQWIDWMKFHRMQMHNTLPNELCTVYSIREYAVQGIFFLLLFNWHEILFPKHL